MRTRAKHRIPFFREQAQRLVHNRRCRAVGGRARREIGTETDRSNDSSKNEQRIWRVGRPISGVGTSFFIAGVLTGKRLRRFVPFFYPPNVIFFLPFPCSRLLYTPTTVPLHDANNGGDPESWKTRHCVFAQTHDSARGPFARGGKNIQSGRDRWRPKVER